MARMRPPAVSSGMMYLPAEFSAERGQFVPTAKLWMLTEDDARTEQRPQYGLHGRKILVKQQDLLFTLDRTCLAFLSGILVPIRRPHLSWR
jgi:hypothetical protein